MKFSKEEIRKSMLLYAVTDRMWLKAGEALSDVVEEVLKNGATFMQIREKDISDEAFIEESVKLKELCNQYNVPFVVNDNVEVALKCGADGVHVGQSDIKGRDIRKIIGDDMILGISVGTVEEAVIAEKAGADYVGIGAIFPTGTKKDARNMSPEMLREIIDAISIPTVAIGGINADNMCQLADTGVDGIAVVSAIFAAEDPGAATAELLDLAAATFAPKKHTALSVAGSDCSGGAGIQADIKTMTMNGVYAMSAVTALTAQNTTGVRSIMEVPPEFLDEQLDAVFEDIYPEAVKIGMVSSSELIKVIAAKLKEYKAENIVVDPVMVATSGSALVKNDAIEVLIKELLPLSTVVTPNIPEAEILSGKKITNEEEMLVAAKYIGDTYSCAVLLKGGHSVNDANDLLYADGEYKWFKGRRINNPNTHGTGCTLSSAIAANLAKGMSLDESVQKAKEYISGALAAMLDLGEGSGPMDHAFALV